jgi:hypothetical protein
MWCLETMIAKLFIVLFCSWIVLALGFFTAGLVDDGFGVLDGSAIEIFSGYRIMTCRPLKPVITALVLRMECCVVTPVLRSDANPKSTCFLF